MALLYKKDASRAIPVISEIYRAVGVTAGVRLWLFGVIRGQKLPITAHPGKLVASYYRPAVKASKDTMTTEKPKRLLAVGDIHGCLGMLQRLMEKVAATADDQLIFLGDYIDRGPDSRGVVDFLLDLQEKFPRTVFLKGNHEQMLLDFLSGEDHLMFLLNGGNATLESYGSAERPVPVIPSTHLAFFDSLATHHVEGDFVFVHAGLRPGVPLGEQDEYDMRWIRGEFINSDFDWGKTVVFGHSPQPEVLRRDNMIGLDTGAVYGHFLTCCDLLTGELWQVSAAAT